MHREHLSRRQLMKAAGVAAIAGSIGPSGAASGPNPDEKNVPKICLEAGLGAFAQGQSEEAIARKIRQLGVNHVLSGGGRIPWEEGPLRERMERGRANGLTLGNLMISGFTNAIYGRPGRDEEIEKVIESIRAAGKAGLPVVEYNWYAHRAMEGYFEETGRAGAGMTGFDYERMKDLPPLEKEGAHSLEEMWRTMTYFLKAVVPVAEQAGVRLALHPNDPPAPLSRGSGQIMATVDGWKRLIGIVDSPANGITYDCGVTHEMGQDPVEVCRYFGSRDRINHVHFRNVKLVKPYERYTEVFIDEGDVDMFAVMKELVKQKYSRLIYPEHPRGIDYDRENPSFRAGYPGGGGYAALAFNVGYTRAMLQAALAS